MTKNELVLDIAKSTGHKQRDIKEIVQMILDSIIHELAESGRLELREFGVFEVKVRRPRKARNPRTGEEVILGERQVVTFKPGKRMAARVLFSVE